jgi:hypothetical protein
MFRSEIFFRTTRELDYLLNFDNLFNRYFFRERPFNLKRDWEGVMLWFFPKKYFDAEFSRKSYFCKQNARKKYSDARFLPIISVQILLMFFTKYGRPSSRDNT